MHFSSIALHLNLDDAWQNDAMCLPVVDARNWGPQLRFSAQPRLIAEFYGEHEAYLASPFLLYGSGDFHYLTALRLRRVAEPIIVVSFDNRRAERAGILEVHPWADDRPAKDRQRRGAILRDNWHEHFGRFLKHLEGTSIYVTMDMDCLRAEEAVTNWESGRFTIADLEWALGKLHESSRIIGGDICGAYSSPHYARFKQRFAAEFDHPKIQLPPIDQIRSMNSAALAKLWPLLA